MSEGVAAEALRCGQRCAVPVVVELGLAAAGELAAEQVPAGGGMKGANRTRSHVHIVFVNGTYMWFL